MRHIRVSPPLLTALLSLLVYGLPMMVCAAGGGTINFNNRVLVAGIDAPVFDVDGVTRLEGSAFLAQLYWGLADETLVPVGAAVPFRTGAGAGYVTTYDPLRTIGAVPPGTEVFVQIRVWETLGVYTTFDEVVQSNAKHGMSPLLLVTTGGPLNDWLPPRLPADLVGLESFQLVQGPLILRQPAGTTAYVGEAVTFDVFVGSPPPLAYQWQVDGRPIAGATGPELVLPAVALADAGSYRVVVSGPTASSTSAAAVLVVHPVPGGATVQLSNRVPAAELDAPVYDLDGVTRLAGTNYVAQLLAGPNGSSLAAVGAPVPFLGGADAGYWAVPAEPWRTIPGVPAGGRAFVQVRVWDIARGATFEASLAAGGKVGQSDVFELVTGGLGSPSPLPAALVGLRSIRLERIPVFVVQPRPQSVLLGKRATNIVHVESVGPAAFQWQRDEVDLPGQTNATLLIASVRSSDAGAYRVVARNATGTAYSDTAALEVVIPTWGGRVRFTNWEPAVGLDAPVYDLDGVTLLSATGYVVQLFAGPTSNALLAATPPIPFGTGPAPGYFSAGTNAAVTLSNVAPATTAYLQVKVWEWTAGQTFAAAVAAGGKFGTSPVFTVVTGGFGEPPSPPADLVGLESFRLEQPPVIVRQPVGVVSYEGETIALETEVRSAAPVTYRWERDGTTIAGADSWRWTRVGATPADSGTYRVVVANATGSSASAEINVLILPIPEGATVQFSNRMPQVGLDAPVFDLDGVTRLGGSNYVAQLRAGTNPDELLPVGATAFFLSGTEAGYWDAGTEPWRRIPGMDPGGTAFVQVYVWDATLGATYQEAVLAGAKAGRSEIFPVVTGGSGSASRAPAPLTGLSSFRLGRRPHIVVPPRGLATGWGAPMSLSVQAESATPMTYQWRFESAPIPGATNASLTILEVLADDAGFYSVTVSNLTGATTTVPVEVVVHPYWMGTGGTVRFDNSAEALLGAGAPVFGPGGVSPLAAAAWLAQLYGGSSADDLIPTGPALIFGTGAAAGYVLLSGLDPTRAVPGVPPGGTGTVQMRVWEASAGTTYERALAAGGRVGASEILVLATGGGGVPSQPPVPLVGLRSFQVLGAPVFVEQPLGGAFYEGQAVHLEARVTSPSPASLQWQRDGVAIPGATQPQLVLPNLRPADTGSYGVVASNAAGSSASALAKVVGVPVPESGAMVHFSNRWPQGGLDAPVLDFDGQRLAGDRFVAQLYAGTSPAQLTAVGPPVPFGTGLEAGYWQPGLEPWRVIPGAVPGTTVLVEVRVWERLRGNTYEEAQAAFSRVATSPVLEVVSGGPGAPSAWPTPLLGLPSLRLRGPPLITAQPQSQTVAWKTALDLEVGVASFEPVTYQWRFQNEDLQGATEPTLTIPEVHGWHLGNYTVRVANSFGATISQPAVVRVAGGSSWGGTIHFNNRVFAAGIDAPILDAQGRPLEGTAWLAELYAGPTADDLVPTGGPTHFRSGSAAGYFISSVRVVSVTPGAPAYLQVRVWEAAYGSTFEEAMAAGGSHGTSKVVVASTGNPTATPPGLPGDMLGLDGFQLERLPQIVRPPAGGVYFVGDTATLEVLATSTSPLTYQWEVDGLPIRGAIGPQLNLPKLELGHSGRYRVWVRNAVGNVSTTETLLLVRTVPALPTLEFANRVPRANLDAPVFDGDRITRLSGPGFVAQLRAGPDRDQLEPLGPVAPFGTGADAGYWLAGLEPWRVVPSVPPGVVAFAQVCVWEPSRGPTCEASLAAGGRVGCSEVFSVTTGGAGSPPNRPAPLAGLRSFHLDRIPQFLRQPVDLVVLTNQTVTFGVEVVSLTPVLYQWRLDGADIPGATARTLEITEAVPTDAGQYSVLVANALGSALSRPAALTVVDQAAVGLVNFNNRVTGAGIDAKVLAADGLTPLAGTAYLAQLYGGLSPDALAPLGDPLPFRTGAAAGYTASTGADPVRQVPGAAAGGAIYLQMRAWESAYGNTYEQARASGAQTGQSTIVAATASGAGVLPVDLIGLNTFKLGPPDPAIVQQPSDLWLFEGRATALDVVTAAGADPLGYQWQRLSGAEQWEDLPGAQSATLPLLARGPEADGTYRVLVQGPGFTVPSRAARVQVLPAQRIGPFEGRFQIPMPAGTGPQYQIEATPDPTEPVAWEALGTIDSPTALVDFVDATAPEHPARFYRARSQTSPTTVSAQVVGFVDVWIPTGYSLVAMPLEVADPTVASLLAGLPDGTIVYAYEPAPANRYRINAFELGEWQYPDQSLGVGEAVWVRNPGAPVRLRLQGAVAVGEATALLPAGWSLRGGLLPQAGAVDAVLRCPVAEGDMVARFEAFAEAPRFELQRFENGRWESGRAPRLSLGEGFWIWKNAPAIWTQALPSGLP